MLLSRSLIVIVNPVIKTIFVFGLIFKIFFANEIPSILGIRISKKAESIWLFVT